MSVMHNATKAIHDRVSASTPQKSHGLNCEGSINAMDLNKDGSRVVVAGRNIFKIYSIEDDDFREKFNLRVGRSLNLNYSTSDVAWSPIEENTLASAATNGAVVIWDLNKHSKSKQDYVFDKIHTRTVNRVRFHQVEGNYILSGSQDGSMKLFDIRTKSVANTFSVGSTSIRDIQFCPSNSRYFAFAAADEGGNVQLWDMRRPNLAEKQFTAHNGPMFCIDWHPTESKWLATGGRDRTIKIWDYTQGKSLFSVATIASVARIKWRPERKYHIASCSLVIDFSVNIWDIRRPYIPFASFEEHKNVATGIVWRKDDSHTIYSSGKDNYLYQHVFKDAVQPADKLVPDGLSISVLGHVSHATKDRNRSLNDKKKYSVFSKQPEKTDLFIDAKSFLFSFTQVTEALSMDWFVNCAQQYILNGKPFEDMCEHNATVSEQNNRFKVAQSWRMLRAIHTSPLLTRSLFRTESVLSNISEKGKEKVHQQEAPKSSEKDSAVVDATSDDDEMTDTDLSNIARGQINPPVEWDILFGGADVQTYPTFGHMENMGSDFKLPEEAFVPRHEIQDPSEAPKQNRHESPPVSGNEIDPNPISNHSSKVINEDVNWVVVTQEVEVGDLMFGDTVENMLKYFAEQGDVQTPVSMLVVLGNKRPNIPQDIQENWFTSYLELLARFKLWTISNALINICHLNNISMMNQQSTVIHLTCNQCNRPLSRVGWLCDRCKSVINTCAICHLPVRGLFVWCQGCSHGGHIKHIQEWLTFSNQCPTGCGHICEYT